MTPESTMQRLMTAQTMERLQRAASAEQPAESPSLMDRARGVVSAGVDMVTGRKSTEFPDMPEFQSFSTGDASKDARLAAGMIFARDPAGQLDIITKTLPDAKVEFDKFNNPIVGIGSDRFYLNRPGASWQDALSFAGEAAPLAGAAGALGGAARAVGGGLVARGLASGAGAGAGSIGMDLAARGLGSESPVDLTRAGVIAGTGAAMEIAAPVAVRVLRNVFGSKEMVSAGKLTDKGRRVVESIGLDPDDVSQRYLKSFQEMTKRGIPDDQAAIAAASQLDVPVPMSRGDITRNVMDQSREAAAQAGALGESPQRTMQAFRQNQNAALTANRDAIQARVGGGTASVQSPTDGAAAVASAVRGNADDAMKGVRSAYDTARQGADARVPVSVIQERFIPGLRQIERDFDTRSLPAIRNLLDDARSVTGTMEGGGTITAAKVRALESWRTRVTNAANSADRTQAAAANRLKRAYDEFIGDVIENNLLQGDDAALEAWKGARTARAAYGRMFEDNAVVRRLVETQDITPEQAMNFIFGAGKLGSKADAGQTMKAVINAVGKDTAGHKALKETAFMRLLKDTAGETMEDGVPRFRGVVFARNVNKALEDAPTAMKELFTPDEMSAIRQLAAVAKRAGERQPGAVNTSATAYEAMRRLQDAMPGGGVAEFFSRWFLRGAARAKNEMDITAATRFRPSAPPINLRGIPAGIAGGMLSQMPEE